MLQKKKLLPVYNKAHSDISYIFIRWSWMRAVLHNGWWLATSLYLVIDGGLTPSQLVFIGVAQGIAAIFFEIPAGVFADTISRKWALVISHMLMAVAMFATGLVKGFPSLMATQMVWGVSWTFASGSDIAWVTDELNEPQHISGVLTGSAQAQLSGAAFGIIFIGILAWSTSLRFAMLSSGGLMLFLGIYIAFRFPEKRFVPIRQRRWLASWDIFKEGIQLVQERPIIWVFSLVTFASNGAADAYSRLFPKQLTNIGLPNGLSPVVWLAGLNVLTLLAGVGAVRFVQNRIGGFVDARRNYVVASVIGAAGMALLAISTNEIIGSASVLLVGGVALSITRVLTTIQVNAQVTDRVRATVHSFLAQAEYLGEIICGSAIGLLARFSNLPIALIGCAALIAIAAVIILQYHPGQGAT